MAVNSVSEQFGITSEAALQIVKDGFIAGADANGQFLDNLKEYPAYFKEAGISADQFVAIIAETNKPVSYTHLDVYKRQYINGAERSSSVRHCFFIFLCVKGHTTKIV